MPLFDPRTLAADCGGEWRGIPAAPVTGVSIDTRTLEPGDLFVALQTERRDGHDFIAEAAARGANAALVAREIAGAPLEQLVVPDTLAALHALARAHRRRFGRAVVAVTGSAGKTSTKELLALLLGDAGEVLATEGNLNNHLGVPLTLLRLDAARHRCAVVEAGVSRVGEMDVIAGMIEPDVALVTVLAPAHLDGLGSLRGVAAEKARLAAHLRPGGVAVFPASCLEHAEFRETASRAWVAVPAAAQAGDLPARMQRVPYAIAQRADATDLCLTWVGGVEEFSLRRVSRGNAANAVLAIVTALHLGESPDAVRARLPRWGAVALRGEVRRVGGRTIYLDCYNANPASMVDSLEGFLAVASDDQARLFVVGSMEELGAEAAALHRATGAGWPLRPGDRMMIFGANAAALAEGVRERHPAAEIALDPDRAEAARVLRDFRGAIFLKGSRRYALETLLDQGAGATAHHREAAA